MRQSLTMWVCILQSRLLSHHSKIPCEFHFLLHSHFPQFHFFPPSLFCRLKVVNPNENGIALLNHLDFEYFIMHLSHRQQTLEPHFQSVCFFLFFVYAPHSIGFQNRNMLWDCFPRCGFVRRNKLGLRILFFETETFIAVNICAATTTTTKLVGALSSCTSKQTHNMLIFLINCKKFSSKNLTDGLVSAWIKCKWHLKKKIKLTESLQCTT